MSHLNSSSDLIEFQKISQNCLISPWIRPLLTTILFNSWLFDKISEFGINIDTNWCVINDRINSFCQNPPQICSIAYGLMFSPTSLALGCDTSLPSIAAAQADTLVILPPIVIPTLPTSMPCLSITAQLTWHAYNFTRHDYAAWASGFELFLESHSLLHRLTENPTTLCASWSQSDSAIIT